MKIVIIGIGKIGYILSEQLCHEGHDIVMIDKKNDVLMNSQNKLDVAVVNGNGASVEVQQEAEVENADLMIAVTSSDEVNILCSLVAHRLGCQNIIIRVRNPEYDKQTRLLERDLGLTFSFNPEKSTAIEIFHLLQFSSFIKRESFAQGRADMVEMHLTDKCTLLGKKLFELNEILKNKVIICAAERNGEVFIPSGDFELTENDNITIAASPKELANVAKVFGVPTVKIKRVMIIGGSRIAAYLAKMLCDNNVEVTIVEQDEERSVHLAEMIPDASIINGNGTEQSLLVDEGIAKMDAVVSLTGVDEENFLISMYANHIGVPKTITKNNRIEYSALFKGTDIDTIVSPKYLAANQIIRYVRASTASSEGFDTLYRILDDKAEALGFTIQTGDGFTNIPLQNLHFRKDTLIAMIIRGQKVIIPGGNDVLMPGDSVIVVTKADYSLSKISDIFTNSEVAGE